MAYHIYLSLSYIVFNVLTFFSSFPYLSIAILMVYFKLFILTAFVKTAMKKLLPRSKIVILSTAINLN